MTDPTGFRRALTVERPMRDKPASGSADEDWIVPRSPGQEAIVHWERLLARYLRIRRAQQLFALLGQWLQEQNPVARERVRHVYPAVK